MKRPQYVFRPNLNDPQHRRAWALLQQTPSARRKEFLVRIIERELDEAEKDYERITTEQAAEKNADVDSGEPDGTEMEVDAQY